MVYPPQNKPELVAPAGSFTAAITALQNGADAIYTGLKSFSARKYAQNLSLNQLRRVITFARVNNKKIYIALNTVIKECELDELIPLLYDLSLMSIDGIIVQDIGLIDIIHTYFPQIPIHASTQLCVYNKEGVKVCENLGVKRVVLARELTINEIKEIREYCPDIELEVFIHGSLCYCYSGLCLASGMLLKRSGNRGECAQVCRSWFEKGSVKGYFFSCNDLMLKENIIKLKAAGINAFKIEGRMKSPGYVYYVCRYYRQILKEKRNRKIPGYDLTASRIIFSRKSTRGFFSSLKGEDIINTTNPSHAGILAGHVKKTAKNEFLLDLTQDIELHDGLFFLKGDNPGEPVRFGIRKMKQKGKIVFTVKKGDSVWISHYILPVQGQPVFQISSKKLDQPELNEKEFPLFRVPLRIELTLYEREIRISIRFNDISHVKSPCNNKGIGSYTITFPFYVELGDKEYPIYSRMKEELFKPPDFLFFPGELIFINKTPYPENKLFIPPSVIKKQDGIYWN